MNLQLKNLSLHSKKPMINQSSSWSYLWNNWSCK